MNNNRNHEQIADQVACAVLGLPVEDDISAMSDEECDAYLRSVGIDPSMGFEQVLDHLEQVRAAGRGNADIDDVLKRYGR